MIDDDTQKPTPILEALADRNLPTHGVHSQLLLLSDYDQKSPQGGTSLSWLDASDRQWSTRALLSIRKIVCQ